MAGGILGTGICFTQECKDRMNQASTADATLKEAQAQAIANLTAAKPASNNSTMIIVIVVITVLVLGVGTFFLLRKK